VCVAAVALAGCTVPLGPGYTIERQRLEVGFLSSSQPRVEVRAAWRVKNTGNRPLTALEVRLPDAKAHGLSELRTEGGGNEVAPSRARAANAIRIVFPEPLPVKEKQEIVLSYALAGGAGVVVNESGFELPPGEWAPVLLPPSAEGSFAGGGEAPKKWEMTVRVPSGFRVHASGSDRGEKKEGDSAVFRFQQKREGGPLFAAGGAYREEKIEAAGSEVIFWTREAMPQGLAERAGEAAKRTAEYYDTEFGEREAGAKTLRIMECPPGESCWPVPRAALPGRALYTPEFWSSGLRTIDRQLALTWLDFRVHPDWSAQPFPMGALPDYAADLAAISRQEDDARRRIVRDLLAEFDHAEKAGKEKVILSIWLSDAEPVRRYGGLKSELFFFALEDAAGGENLHRAIQHLLRTYAGQTWRASDLRSALELESGKDLAGLFRAWLTETGIPEEFRSRY